MHVLSSAVRWASADVFMGQWWKMPKSLPELRKEFPWTLWSNLKNSNNINTKIYMYQFFSGSISQIWKTCQCKIFNLTYKLLLPGCDSIFISQCCEVCLIHYPVLILVPILVYFETFWENPWPTLCLSLYRHCNTGLGIRVGHWPIIDLSNLCSIFPSQLRCVTWKTEVLGHESCKNTRKNI